ncbi:MAG: ATP-binding cassette domain-containing protein [Ruminococcaceae bacterium]|nr:ATP-binding cassette domain-containing protein [Oscillospiraceae bacterium]
MDIKITDLKKTYQNRTVFENLNLTVKKSEKIAIMGESGCGKTTLLKIISGLEKADGGRIEGLPEKISFVFQEDRLFEKFTALSNAKFAAGKNIGDETAREHLIEVGLTDSTLQTAENLSGGMKRRVSIVRAVLAKAELLLLDEPFKGLDEENRENVSNYILKNTADTTVILVTHDRDEAELLSADIIKWEDLI